MLRMTESENIEKILAEVADQAEQMRDKRGKLYRSNRPAAEPSQVYSIRIPVSHLGRIRALASGSGIAPTAMLRDWILDRLAIEDAPADATAPAAVIPIRRTAATPASELERQFRKSLKLQELERRLAA